MSEHKVPEQTWLFSFGSGQQYDGRFVVIPGDYISARAEMLRYFGNAWSFQYPGEDRQVMEQRYGMVELPRDEWPAPVEVPDEPAVGEVRDRDGDVWQRDEHGNWRYGVGNWRYGECGVPYTWAELVSLYGPITVPGGVS